MMEIDTKATKISDLKFSRHPVGRGERALVTFPNGYVASVLRGGPFYTTNGTYEIAIMANDEVCYDTPITDDVLGYLSEDEANEALEKISSLPKRKAK